MCFDFLYSFCLKHFSSYEEFGEILQMYTGLHVMYPNVIQNIFHRNLHFLDIFRKVLKHQI